MEELESETRTVGFVGYGYSVRCQKTGFNVVSSRHIVLLENQYRAEKVNVFRAAVILILMLLLLLIIIIIIIIIIIMYSIECMAKGWRTISRNDWTC